MIRVVSCVLMMLVFTVSAAAQGRVATPTFSVDAGEYSTVILVVVRVSTPDAVIHYTLNGHAPTESDPVVASGSTIAVNTPLTLKARAFRPGMRPSAIRTARYVFAREPAAPPTLIVGPGDVAAGSTQTVVALPDGQVLAWEIDAPAAPVESLRGVTAVAAGAAHALAATWDGNVYAWGANGSGRLGDGTTEPRQSPVYIAGVADATDVAAGTAHSMALTSDGRVFVWGGNARGQLGTGSRTGSMVPIQITQLSDVVAIAAGDAHSIAVTDAGDVFAWGANQYGQLGDGSHQDRLTPVRLALSGVAAVAAGNSHSIALLHDGSVYAWGRNNRGQLGTAAQGDASVPTPVAELEALAIAAGGQFSAAIGRDAALMTWGANGAGQLGDDSTTRFRTTPGAGPLIQQISAFALGDQHAIAATSGGDLWTWGAGAAVQAALSDIPEWGPPIASYPPAAPTMSPPSGTFSAPVLVTLSTDADNVVIRYPLDGTEPQSTSTMYDAPFLVSTNTIVQARAFGAEYALWSEVASASYLFAQPVDSQPPTVTARTTPPVGEGWALTPVTVSFVCEDDSGWSSCPGPVTLDSDGEHIVTGTAVDAAGNAASTTIAVRVDVEPPVISLPGGLDGTTFTEPQVAFSVAINDMGSGASAARCNDTVVAIEGGLAQCVVSLRPGLNTLTVNADDAVGRTASAGATVTLAGAGGTLTLAPAERRMLVNEVAVLSLRDEYGSPVANATWFTSDGAVARLSADDPPLVTATAPGTVTITAMKNGLSSDALIEVHAALELPPGTVRWTVAPTPGHTMAAPIFTHRVDAATPDMFIVENRIWGEALLRAVTAEGQVLWSQESPGIPLMGDAFGGVIAGVLYDVNQGADFQALVRLGRAGGVAPWRYQSDGSVGNIAQAPDGTIYAVEYLLGRVEFDGSEIWDKYFVAIDGRTGRRLQRAYLEREFDRFISQSPGVSTCGHTFRTWAPDTTGPIVGSDGRGYLLVRRYERTATDSCSEGVGSRSPRTYDIGVELLVLERDKEAASRTVYERHCDTPAFVIDVCDASADPHQLVPDGVGGLVAIWSAVDRISSNRGIRERHATRWDENWTRADTLVDARTRVELVGQAGRALVQTATGMSAIDLAAWNTSWSRPLFDIAVLAALPDGRVAVQQESTQELKMLDTAGELEPVSAPLPVTAATAVHEFGNWIGLRNGSLHMVSGGLSDATRWTFSGNRQRQQSMRNPGIGIFAKSHAVRTPLDYQHISIRVVPTFQGFWRDLKPSDLVNQDEYGNYFMTIGAGTADGDSSLLCSGTLTKGINRLRDVALSPVHFEQLAVGVFEETRIINDLYVYFGNYRDDLPYTCLPETNPGAYNSNSFISGLLRKADAPLPIFPIRGVTAPGWPTPVPARYFELQ